MPLITPVEVSAIAFFNALDSDFVLPAYIVAAENTYVIPLVTQAVVDTIKAAPGDYTVLLEDYIKPYEAFCIKNMFYNQFLTETDTFAISDEQRLAAIQEIILITASLRQLLSDYLNANIFAAPVTPSTIIVAGIIKKSAAVSSTSTSSTGSTFDLTSSLSAASVDVPADADSFNFIQSSSNLLKKLTWSNLKLMLRNYFGTMARVNFWQGTETQYNALNSYDSNTIYFIWDDPI
jgi:hypothetical protein